MKHYIHPLKLQLARTAIYHDGEPGCCRVTVTYGLLHTTWKTSPAMSPGCAAQEHTIIQKALRRQGYWSLRNYLLTSAAYIAISTTLLYHIIHP